MYNFGGIVIQIITIYQINLSVHENMLQFAIFQQMAALAWVKNGNNEPYSWVTSARVGYELYQRVNSSSEVDIYQVSELLY